MALVFVILWVLPSVLIGLGVGYCVGKNHAPPSDNEAVRLERAALLKALAGMLESTQRLSTDVDSHNHELAQVGQQVGNLKLQGDLEEVQQGFLQQIVAVIDSNKRLEDDLVCARYQLESQGRELDRTRTEARTDPLSGISNRKAFDETLQYHLLQGRRQNEPFTLVLLDIDHFKWINDTHGHQAGDLVVRGVAQQLAGLVREHDSVFRLGGDEFALLLPGANCKAAAAVAERIRVAMGRTNYPLSDDSQQVSVTCSLGLATGEATDTGETLLTRADQALYRSKGAGRNSLHCALAADRILPAAEVLASTSA